MSSPRSGRRSRARSRRVPRESRAQHCPVPRRRRRRGVESRRVDSRAAAARFLDSPALSEGTRRAYRVDVGEFCRWLDGRDLESVDVRTIVEYVAYLGTARRGQGKLAPATIARKLAAVRSYLRHALGSARVPDARVAPRRG